MKAYDKIPAGTGDDANSVTAWMPLPNPYKGE